MIKTLIRLTTISLAVSALYIYPSHAKSPSVIDNTYLKVGIGAMKFSTFKETENGFGYIKKAPKTNPIYNIGVGYKFNDSVRTDLNLQYSEVKYKAAIGPNVMKQNIKTIAAFVNGYYDINFDKALVPYLTAGFGIGKNNVGNLKEINSQDREGKNTTNFIWNIGFGARYKLNKTFTVDLGYRYMDLGKTKTDNSKEFPEWDMGGKQKIKGHQIIGSLAFNL